MKIGLVDKKDFEQIDILLKKHFTTEKTYEIFLNPSECKNFDLVIINNSTDYKRTNFFIRNLNKDGIILLNFDEVGNENKIFFGDAKIISYGFNPEANITASSVQGDDITTVQCCLQKALSTFSGNTLEEQEFSVNVKDKDVYNILASVAALLIHDVEVGSIGNFY